MPQVWPPPCLTHYCSEVTVTLIAHHHMTNPCRKGVSSQTLSIWTIVYDGNDIRSWPGIKQWVMWFKVTLLTGRCAGYWSIGYDLILSFLFRLQLRWKKWKQHFVRINRAMARWLSSLECRLLHQKVAGWIPSQGTYLGCRFPERVHQLMFLSHISLSLSLSLSLLPLPHLSL